MLRAEALTELEQRVLRHAADGLGVRATAEETNFSPVYIRHVRVSVMRKLEVANVTAAVAVALRRGLL
jgi:DNA-binding NarL/FixJ family response regulator